jgi:hypothetical protein
MPYVPTWKLETMDSKGGWCLQLYRIYLIYTSVSKALRGQANGLVNALRAERTNEAE